MSETTCSEFFEVWSRNVRTVKLNSLQEHAEMIFGNYIDHMKLKLHIIELRWNKSRRDKSRFLTDNTNWLQGTICVVDYKIYVVPST